MTIIRYPVAAEFYGENIRSQMHAFLDRFHLPCDLPQDLLGAVVPHAGWAYSGRVAARALFCLAKCSNPATVILLGADHTGVRYPTVFPEGEWHTPVTLLSVDHTLVKKILAEVETRVVADAQAHRQEHAIEVILPMVSFFWPDCQIVPITVPPRSESVLLGMQLGSLLGALCKNTIVIASTDLTHYGVPYGLNVAGGGKEGYEWLVHNDDRMIASLCAADGERILEEARERQNACGAGAAAALAALATNQGHGRGRLIEYTNSHGSHSTDTFTFGVGYASLVY